MGKDVNENLDFLKMSHDEFQKYWLSLAEKDAETDNYTKEILRTVKQRENILFGAIALGTQIFL